MPDTILVLSGVGVPRWSARGLTQTLSPIEQAGNFSRSINGTLMDLSAEQFQKFKSTITCTDQRAPAMAGLWPGQEVEVECVCELVHVEDTGAPIRPVVTGSERTEEGFVFYRPVLQMRVISFETSKDEWAADVPWQMELEEI